MELIYLHGGRESVCAFAPCEQTKKRDEAIGFVSFV